MAMTLNELSYSHFFTKIHC